MIISDHLTDRLQLEKLKARDIEIDMSDYGGFEKVGDLGFSLPQNNEQLQTSPGDVILYLGSRFVIYYGHNNWELTRIGKIINKSSNEIKDLLDISPLRIRLSQEE